MQNLVIGIGAVVELWEVLLSDRVASLIDALSAASATL